MSETTDFLKAIDLWQRRCFAAEKNIAEIAVSKNTVILDEREACARIAEIMEDDAIAKSIRARPVATP